jgi:hypothetical protein
MPRGFGWIAVRVKIRGTSTFFFPTRRENRL